MGKGGYLGGSTVLRVFPKLSGRKGPKKGALDSWIDEARHSDVQMPDGVRLNPMEGAKRTEKEKNKKKCEKGKRRKKKSGKSSKVQKKVNAKDPVGRKPNEALPEYADLVKALREKYAK